MEEDVIEEASARLTRSESRWVDGSEVDSESPPLSLQEAWSTMHEGSPSGGSFRRRLSKKPRRVDSLDVEAMGIAASHKHGPKVRLLVHLRLSSSCSFLSRLGRIYSLPHVWIFFFLLVFFYLVCW